MMLGVYTKTLAVTAVVEAVDWQSVGEARRQAKRIMTA